MRALAIAHELDGIPGQIGVRLNERGFAVDVHVVTDDYEQPNVSVPFPDRNDYDLLVPMGSIRSMTTPEDISSWVDDELDMIRAAHQEGQPVLGICFGGQLIATALGGSVERAPEGELGWYEIGDGDVPNPVGSGPWFEWHHDRFTPPPGATVLARNANAEQLFQIGSTVGTQFHPEVDVPHIELWLKLTDDEFLAQFGYDRDSLVADTARHNDANIAQCHRLVDWYLDEVTDLGTRLGAPHTHSR